MIRSYIRGGNGFIRSSIACHLICIILLNRRSFHKKNVHSQKRTTSQGCGFPKTGCYTFIGSLTSPYQAGFLAPESSLPLSFSCVSTMDYEIRSSVTVTGSLRVSHLIPLFLPAYSCQHLICSLWNYTDIILPPVTVFVNPLKGFLLFFYQPFRWCCHGVNSSVSLVSRISTRIFAVFS